MRAFAIGAAVAFAALAGQAQTTAPKVTAFATPEAAVEAFIAALQAPSLQPIMEIFDRSVIESVPPEERSSDAMRRAAGDRLAAEPRKIVYEDDAHTRARVIVGREDFRLPIPLVKTADGWVFDGKAGVAEMDEKRTLVNEANAIRALHAFARAQELYRGQDRDGNGVLEYAQRIRGSEGRLDGLVNAGVGVPGPATSLLNEGFARAEGKPGDPEHHPVGGYGYAILTAQGPGAEGGARNYLVNGHLFDGYAILAWPTRPGKTGDSTFIMNQSGTIYEHDFGDGTLEAVRRIAAFDPDEKWTRVDDE
jgi:hypothetical protein